MQAALARHPGLDPEHFELEVLESAAIADMEQAIGILLMRQREMERAQTYLERAVALQPQATAYRALAELMEQQRLFEKANFYYRQSSAV